MRVVFFVVFCLQFNAIAFAQLPARQNHIDPMLLQVKNDIENHFAGSTIRGLREEFTITSDKQSNRYIFNSDVSKTRSASQQKKLNKQLNKTLKGQYNRKLEGIIYFDTYLDSGLVDIKFITQDTVYKFNSMLTRLHPKKGYQTFYKGLHDEIKKKIKQGQIQLDSILKLDYIAIYAGRKKTFITENQYLSSNTLDSFFIANRWQNGLSSYLPLEVKAEIILQKEYFSDQSSWIDIPINPTYDLEGDNSSIKIKLITPFKIGSQTTFFSTKTPNKDKKTTASVSLTYDELLGKYRLPVVHFGATENTNKLITEVMAISGNGGQLGHYSRIYFYREH